MGDKTTIDGSLGASLRRSRIERKLSLREMARTIGISPANLSAIELGKTRMTVDRLRAVAGALDLSMSAVMREAEMSDWEPPGLAASASINFDKQQFEGEWRVFPPLDVDPILASAITCFLEVGYHGSTIRTIASGANISVPGLYHHYHNKQELLVAILDLTMQELYARLSSARSEGSTHVDRYCLMVEALALFHIHRRPLGLIGSSEMRYIEGSERTRVASLRTGLQRMMDNEVTGAVHDGEFATMHPADAARAISNMCVALSQWYSEAGPLTPNEIARQYARFAYDTMRANGWAESTGAEFV